MRDSSAYEILILPMGVMPVCCRPDGLLNDWPGSNMSSPLRLWVKIGRVNSIHFHSNSLLTNPIQLYKGHGPK